VANGNKEKSVNIGSVDENKISGAVIEIFKELAELLVDDAEGATKKIRVKVVKAKNVEQAKSVAFTIAESSLVKTAMFGSDANWGRILSAIGRDPTVKEINNIEIKLNGQPLVKKGYIDPSYSEKLASKEMKKKEIIIDVKLGSGKEGFEVITSDLSEDYVLINSDYRS
jgi:glutamate N-acetyltransferase/amino-acid N-acetyltransferase